MQRADVLPQHRADAQLLASARPLIRDAMPSVSKRTENVRTNDSAVNITEKAPANAATIHRLTGVPATKPVSLLNPSTTANRQTAAAITQPAGGQHVGSSGS